MEYPLINGIRYDFSSLDLTIDGWPGLFKGLKSINYSHKLEPGVLRGNRAHIIGRTRGQYEASADMEIWKSEWNELVAALSARGAALGGLGFMEVPFLVVAMYAEPGQLPVRDALHGCRISESSQGGSEGADPLVVKVTLNVMHLTENGSMAVSPGRFLGR